MMIELAIAVGVGVIIGWQFPQPAWAKATMDAVITFVKDKLPK